MTPSGRREEDVATEAWVVTVNTVARRGSFRADTRDELDAGVEGAMRSAAHEGSQLFVDAVSPGGSIRPAEARVYRGGRWVDL